MMRHAAEAAAGLRAISAPLTVALMGCMVNGPGEAKEADLGIACGRGAGVLFKKGKLVRRVEEGRIVAELVAEARKMAAAKSRPRKD